MIEDLTPLIEAATNEFLVTLNYTKKTTGEFVTHTGGIYEIGPDKNTGATVIWLWDTEKNDTIRKFLPENVVSFQVLGIKFFRPQPWPIKINGAIVVP